MQPAHPLYICEHAFDQVCHQSVSDKAFDPAPGEDISSRSVEYLSGWHGSVCYMVVITGGWMPKLIRQIVI